MEGNIVRSPIREYVVICVLGVLLATHLFWAPIDSLLVLAAGLGALPLAIRAGLDLAHARISLDVFNLFAAGISFAAGEVVSAVFIVLMITSASALEWHTAQRARDAVRELLTLKPRTALREADGTIREIPADSIRVGDTIIAKTGSSIAVDGIVTHGRALVNEALVTGESMPVEKRVGARVLVSTIIDSGALTIRATHVGADSTIERMAALMKSAAAHKSQPERLADKFASIFLPVVIAGGALVYIITRDSQMTAAFFLVACADDMAVAIPLAMTASLGWAARRGVIVKGGAWLHTLARVRTVILDKTGTLTYGNFRLERADRAEGISEKDFWTAVGIAEKFSDHPIGRALFALAQGRVEHIPDADSVRIVEGGGVDATYRKSHYFIGNDSMITSLPRGVRADVATAIASAQRTALGAVMCVVKDDELLGVVSMADVPRAEATTSIQQLHTIGVHDVRMFTGDNERTAQRVGQQLGISHIQAQMKPDDKLRELERITQGPVAMVGDGINDAPALARADVGIAMGSGGTAIASEAADVIILTDDLQRLPEIIQLGRRTMSVIRWDIFLWSATNLVGFALVLTGFIGPAFAAFYNFATDFIPMFNSARLFRNST